MSSLSTVVANDGSGFGKRVSLGSFQNFFFAIGTKESTHSRTASAFKKRWKALPGNKVQGKDEPFYIREYSVDMRRRNRRRKEHIFLLAMLSYGRYINGTLVSNFFILMPMLMFLTL